MVIRSVLLRIGVVSKSKSASNKSLGAVVGSGVAKVSSCCQAVRFISSSNKAEAEGGGLAITRTCSSTGPGSDNRLLELRRKLKDDSSSLRNFISQPTSTANGDEKTKTRFEEPSYYDGIRKPVNEATTINPEVFRSPEFYKVEQYKLRDSWQVVAHVDDLRQHGDTVVATLDEQPIFVARGKDGVVRGFYNVCRHRGARLLSESGRYPVISCPYHRWGYSLDGRLLATPMWKGDGVTQAETGGGGECDAFLEEDEPTQELKDAFSTDHVKNFHKKDYGLLPIRVDTWGPYVYANCSGMAPPLNEYLGDLVTDLEEYPLDELVSFKSSSFEVQANWKLLGENFMEYYHLPSVHPELMDVCQVKDHHRAQGKGMYIGYVTYPLTNADSPVDLDRLPPFEGLQGKNETTAWFHHHFPNAFYFLLPHSVYSVIFEPTGPTTTIEHASLLVHPDALKGGAKAEQVLQEMWDYYDMVNRQDLKICEEVQQGLRVEAYKGGRMTFGFEEPLNRFQHMIADYMTGNVSIPPGDGKKPYEFQTW